MPLLVPALVLASGYALATTAGMAVVAAFEARRPADDELSPAAATVVGRWREKVSVAMGRVGQWSSPSVAENLKRRVAIDQAARAAIPDWLSSGLSASDQDAANKAIWAELRRIDSDNTAYLRAHLPADGWFRIHRDGEVVATDAWIIVQHSPDRLFQRQVLDRMAPLLPTGDVSGRRYAMLYDRVAILEGRRQRYGSQVVCVAGRFEPSPVEDPGRLDGFRASVCLGPIAEYLRLWDGKTC